jgi:hypothetical protein
VIASRLVAARPHIRQQHFRFTTVAVRAHGPEQLANLITSQATVPLQSVGEHSDTLLCPRRADHPLRSSLERNSTA